AEGGLLALGLVAASWLLFSGQGASPTSLPALLYVPLPLLLWAALRLGTGGLSLSVLFVAGWAVLYAAAGQGPFSGLAPIENVVSLQLYLIAVTVPLLALAALMRERERTAGLLRASEERYRTVVEAAPIGITGVDPAGRFLQTNRAFREMLGYGEDELRHLSFDDVSAPEDAAASERLLAEL